MTTPPQFADTRQCPRRFTGGNPAPAWLAWIFRGDATLSSRFTRKSRQGRCGPSLQRASRRHGGGEISALAVTLLFFATLARAEIEFVGLLVTPDRSLFALIDDPAHSATWRALGQDFAGCSLASFDAKSDTLTLIKKDGAPLRLRLKDDAKVKHARLELSGTIAVGQGEKIELSRVTLTYDHETVLPLRDGLTWHITPTRMADGNLLWRLSIDRTVQDGDVKKTQQISAPRVVTRPGHSFKIVIDELEFAFTPITP